LSNPECYKEKGLEKLYENLKKEEKSLEDLFEVYFEVEEKNEQLITLNLT
jgi:hypothetical protein